MKIIKAIFIALLALSLIAIFGIFLFFQIFNTDRFLPQITNKASLLLGRPVSIGGVGLGLSLRGITLDAGPVTVADDADFTAQPFIEIDKVRMSLDLRSLVLHKKVHITSILLQSPQVHFIRSQEGNFNVQSIGQESQASPSSNVIASPKGEAISERTTNFIGTALSLKSTALGSTSRSDTIKSITIQDAAVSFIDQSPTTPMDIWLLHINVSLKDLSLTKPVQLSFDAAPLLLKAIEHGEPDSPIFKNIKGAVQLNLAHPRTGDITANGVISADGGVIKDFNIFKSVMSRTLGLLGNMEDNIDDLLNGQLKDKLDAPDTDIIKAMIQFSIYDKAFYIDDSLIATDIFELKAQGSVDQGLNVDLQTMLHLNADVSAALTNEIEGLKYLYDNTNRIAIGASLKGVIPHLKYKMNKDFRKKSRKMLMEEGGNILGVLLGGGQSSQQEQDTPSQGSEKKTKIKFKNIFKTFLQ